MQIIRLFSLLTIVLILFFYLINNINTLTSILNRQNRVLNRQQNDLQARLERKSIEVSSDLSLEIESKLNAGTLKFINQQETTSITDLQPPPKPAPSDNLQSPELSPTNQGIISR